MATPYAHLGLRYIPLGGLTVANAPKKRSASCAR
jgi:hypothetical protein